MHSKHERLPCPLLSAGVGSNSQPSSQWCHPAISSSVTPFSSFTQSFLASGSFPVSHLSSLLNFSPCHNNSILRGWNTVPVWAPCSIQQLLAGYLFCIWKIWKILWFCVSSLRRSCATLLICCNINICAAKVSTSSLFFTNTCLFIYVWLFLVLVVSHGIFLWQI